MLLTEEFRQAVYSEDVISIRIMMKDSLLIDPTFRQFDEMNKESSGVQGLYQDHDGRDFKNKHSWNDDYMNQLMVQVMNNFSKQRINHLKDVIRYLRPKEHDDLNSQHVSKKNDGAVPNQRTRSSYKDQKRQDQKDGKYLRSKLPIGAVAGGVCGGITASLVGVPAVGGVVTGAVVGAAGTIAICKFNEKRA